MNLSFFSLESRTSFSFSFFCFLFFFYEFEGQICNGDTTGGASFVNKSNASIPLIATVACARSIANLKASLRKSERIEWNRGNQPDDRVDRIEIRKSESKWGRRCGSVGGKKCKWGEQTGRVNSGNGECSLKLWSKVEQLGIE